MHLFVFSLVLGLFCHRERGFLVVDCLLVVVLISLVRLGVSFELGG